MTTSTFDCPRCHSPVTERFYGPCTDCRSSLRADADHRASGRAVVMFLARRSGWPPT